jgi:hypothetical protein
MQDKGPDDHSAPIPTADARIEDAVRAFAGTITAQRESGTVDLALVGLDFLIQVEEVPQDNQLPVARALTRVLLHHLPRLAERGGQHVRVATALPLVDAAFEADPAGLSVMIRALTEKSPNAGLDASRFHRLVGDRLQLHHAPYTILDVGLAWEMARAVRRDALENGAGENVVSFAVARARLRPAQP